ncbi:protein FAM92A1-like isoform X2 [Dinothrombium tinctorium]|uniref:Protein FAM92A1-like isoform X2 n=1 Tax=Dinothrombium tinctorium TaxID=1965070 RepID=A0A3S3PM21_9ACAR|nr:protein FAM92A1-like isoform X2 [Dinothrombium tinctorium]
MNKINELRSIQERCESLEKNLNDVYNQLAVYARKVAKCRDEGDSFAECVQRFAESENVNRSIQHALTNFADIFSTLQTWRDFKVEKIENDILDEISVYGELCKKIKDEIRKGMNSSRVRSGSSENVSSSGDSRVENQIEKFEERKIKDVKKWFQKLVEIELLFHAKSLELWTEAYKYVASIEEETDLNDFRKRFPINSKAVKSSLKSDEKPLSSLRRFNSTPDVKNSESSMTASKTNTTTKAESADTKSTASDLDESESSSIDSESEKEEEKEKSEDREKRTKIRPDSGRR